MDKKEAWELARQVTRHFMAHYGDVMDRAAISIGLQPADYFLVIIPAYLFEPDPISSTRLRKKMPYNSPAYYEKPLLNAKIAGFLDEVPEGGYVLNQRGQEAFRKVMEAAYRQMEQLTLLPPKKMDELKLVLAKLVQASILSPEHVCKWNILHSRRLDPGRNVVAAITIDQYLSDLAAYRDDAHLASWSSYSISAHAWDILGVLWQRMGSSTTDVIDVVKKRCWTEDESLAAIEELHGTGWIVKEEKLNLTEEGQNVRDNAEERTNELFFSPWQVLTDIEYKRFCELLTQLNENLAPVNSTRSA